MSLEPGANFGQYRIVEQAGRGGMASVYKAYQPSLARHVAIKVLPSFFAEEAGFRERFQQEAIAIAQLRHPNILTVFDYGEENGVAYIVTEFVDGGTLSDQLGTKLPVDYAVRMLAPVASALDYAHARGVLHRDIKPSNILLARDGTPILSDFGLARMMESSLPRLTQTGMSVGTPEYMAPEQGAGEELGPPADQYALAVVAYEMLTGRVPFAAATPLATLLAHMSSRLPLPRELNPDLSEAVQEVLLKGLAKTPADRYPSASAFAATLGDAARGPMAAAHIAAAAMPSAASAPAAAIAASASPPAEAAAASASAWRWPRRLPLGFLAGMGAAVLIAAVGVGGVLIFFDSAPSGPAPPPEQPAAQPAAPAPAPKAPAVPPQVQVSDEPERLVYKAVFDGTDRTLEVRTVGPEGMAEARFGPDGGRWDDAIEIVVRGGAGPGGGQPGPGPGPGGQQPAPGPGGGPAGKPAPGGQQQGRVELLVNAGPWDWTRSELDLRAPPSQLLIFWPLWAANGESLAVVLDLGQGILRVVHRKPPSPQVVFGPVAVSGLSGPISLVATARDDRFVVYAQGEAVAEFEYPGGSGPRDPERIEVFGEGTLGISGLRYYAPES